MKAAATSKTVLITGASSGIGYELAMHYLQSGDRVFVMARTQASLESLVKRYPQTCSAIAVDLSSHEAARAAGLQLSTMVDQLNLVIMNAGTCEYLDAKHFSLEPFTKVMAVNWQGALHTLEFALPLLRKAAQTDESAQLVGVSSMASRLPMPRAEAYGASKVALEYLLNSLRVDLKHEAVEVICVRPGFVKTPLTDRNDFAMPFIQTAGEAAVIIARGIARRKWIIAFPWPLVALINAVAILPLRWQTSLLQKIRYKN
jgi:short-subunit dehydrogenase